MDEISIIQKVREIVAGIFDDEKGNENASSFDNLLSFMTKLIEFRTFCLGMEEETGFSARVLGYIDGYLASFKP